MIQDMPIDMPCSLIKKIVVSYKLKQGDLND